MFANGADERDTHARGIEIRAHQQPRAARRRERHAEHEFRVVGETVLRIRLGPREIEYEFAERVRLDVGRGGRGQAFIVVQQDWRGLPSGGAADAMCRLELCEERVAQEG
jgi:hypothetical protein